MSQQWLHTAERSTKIALLFMRWVSLHLGRTFTRLLIPIICLYFILFSQQGWRASKKFLAKTRNKKITLSNIYRHYWTYGAVILDRVYFTANKSSLFDIRIHGEHLLKNILHNKQGCILLGSHLGSFDALRALAVHQHQLPLKVLMYPQGSQQLTKYMDQIHPQLAESMIVTGQADSLLKAYDALQQGYLLGILNDRVMNHEKSLPCQFFNETIHLPTGPLKLAKLSKVPVILFFALYRGNNRYDIHFESFTECYQSQDMATLLQRYANRLEYYAKDAPYNWFNFYDYWS
ncbi:MAG: lipid A biosynthesis acyltransferase [Gammaproteobacteria bacterium]|nr:lipid A biosynthesis acyltransferase [Gammaproteobacteria bacterium]